MPADDVLALLANPVNRSILAHVATEPMYTRRVAELVGLSEEEASRRLRAFERFGVLTAEWANVGRTVRLYRLAQSGLTLSFTGEGVAVEGLARPAALPSGLDDRPPAVELVGRSVELAELRSLTERGRVCLHGIGGIGKTALASALAAEWSGTVAWRTAAREETPALLLRRLVSRLRPVSEGAAEEDEAVLVRWVAQAASRSQALLVLDRAEVASDAAIGTFADIASRMTAGAAVLVARAFPSALPRTFASFQVGGLAREAAHEILRPAAIPDARIDELHAQTGGHPLSLLLARESAVGGRPSDVAALLRGSGVREFLLGDVLAQLPEADRDAVLRLVVLELPFQEEEAGVVAAHPRPHDLLLRLAARGLVVRLPDGWLVHDLVRAALAADASPVTHRLAAQALLVGGDPARVLEAIRHALAGGDVRLAGAVVEEEAIHRRHRFAEHGLARPYAQALKALEAATTSPSLRAACLLEEVHLARRAGDDAAKLLGRARPMVPARGPLRARLRVEEAQTLRETDPHGALRHLDAVASEDVPASLLADALLERAHLAEEADADLAPKAFAAALEAAERCDDPRLLALAYSGAARVRQARLGDGRALAEEALRLARLVGHLRGEAMARTTLTEESLHPRADPVRVREGRLHAETNVEIARRLDDSWMLACALTDVGVLAARVGDHAAAMAAGEEALAAARRVGSLFLAAGAESSICEALVATGRAEEGRRRLRMATEAFEATARGTPRSYAVILHALAQAEEACGHRAEAARIRRRAEAIWP